MKTATILSAIAALAATAAAAAELKIDVTHKVECERKTKKGDKVSMHYRGTLAADGSQFDASASPPVVCLLERPLLLPLGASSARYSSALLMGRSIRRLRPRFPARLQGWRCWDQGLLDMCIGEKRTLTIPPEFGYGDRGIGPIPGGATLIFETELVGIAGVEPPKKAEKVDDATAPEGDEEAVK
ncbi:hypothetical protein MY4038_008846, partial [Beauveria bassiana]